MNLTVLNLINWSFNKYYYSVFPVNEEGNTCTGNLIKISVKQTEPMTEPVNYSDPSAARTLLLVLGWDELKSQIINRFNFKLKREHK